MELRPPLNFRTKLRSLSIFDDWLILALAFLRIPVMIKLILFGLECFDVRRNTIDCDLVIVDDSGERIKLYV